MTKKFGISLFKSKSKLKNGFNWWLSGKESTCKAGHAGAACLIPGSERSPKTEGMATQYSCPKCLKNPMDRGTWQAQSTGSQSQIQLKPLSIQWALKKLISRFKGCIYLPTVDFNYKFQYSLLQTRYSPKNSCFVSLSLSFHMCVCVCVCIYIFAFGLSFSFCLSCNSDILACIKILSII